MYYVYGVEKSDIKAILVFIHVEYHCISLSLFCRKKQI